jgi:hypothetical protein
MNPLRAKRVTLIILLVLSTCIAITLVAISYSKREWETMTASLSVITAILAIWASLNLTWKQEDDKLPQIIVFIDNISHKYAYSLAIKNEGGSPAYNVRIDWVKPILDFEGKAPRFVDYEDDFDFHYLGTSNQYSRFLFGSDKFQQRVRESNEPLIFEGIISYSFTSKGRYREKRKFKISLEPFRKHLNNANDQMDFYFENKKLTEYLKSVAESLKELSKKSETNE